MIPIRKPEVNAIVSVDGERVDFVSLKISQEMGEHHDFELLLDHKTFSQSFFNNPEKHMELISTKVVIDLRHGDDVGGAYVFSGTITNVRMIAREGMHGGILIIGKSNTIELERGDTIQTYSSTNLQTILKEITAGVSNLSVEIAPEWKSDIDFAIQYREDDWRFLQRILHQYNERYYYTGIDLVIGPHPEWPVTTLTYDLELRSLEVCSRLLPNQYSEYYYQRENHMTLRQESPGTVENAGSTLQTLSKRSDRLTKHRKPNIPVAAYVPDMGSLNAQSNRRKVSTGGQMMYIKGECKTCDILIGRLIRINMPKNMGGMDMGLFRVYKCMHQLDEAGHYTCYFEALPADLEYIPTPKVPVPTPQPIECEVWSNQDPHGIGRIQVKFPFDERVCETWIPVMTPDSGGNGKGLGPVSRGFSFIPEVSDSVLVNFIDGPELSHPVVIGSMFHAANALNLGGGKGNHIKTITDKSSGQIIMNTDEGGEWGITIRDRNGNVIHLDTKGKNIEITAPETMRLNAKNIFINAEENITTYAGKDNELNVGHDNTTTIGNNNLLTVEANHTVEVSGNMQEHIEGDFQSIADKDRVEVGKEGISVSCDKKITHHAMQKVNINSGEKTKNY